MKIIHVEDYFDPTAGYQINELLYASRNFDDEVILITSTDMSPFYKEVNHEEDRKFETITGTKIIRLSPIMKISSRLVIKDLFKNISVLNPDIVYMHGIADFKDLQLWFKKKQYVLFRDSHMSWVASRNRFSKIFYKFFKFFFASIINNSDKYSKIFALGLEEYEYLKALGINDEKIDFLPHGFNDEIIYFDSDSRDLIRRSYNIKEDEIVISYIGKLDFKKCPDLIFDIISEFSLENRIIKLLFIGQFDENYKIYFENKRRSKNIKYELIVDESKPFSELRKYFSASDICIFPKQTTLSSIHAQLCGCPVIMESHTSNIERVVNRHHLFNPDDLESAARILESIVINNDYQKIFFLPTVEKLLIREYKKQVEKIIEIAQLNT